MDDPYMWSPWFSDRKINYKELIFRAISMG
jgi:hypothetical protein